MRTIISLYINIKNTFSKKIYYIIEYYIYYINISIVCYVVKMERFDVSL